MSLDGIMPDASECAVAKIVVLQPDGSIEEHSYDSNPAENSLVKIMGSQVTIVGMWRSQDVILMSLRDPGSAPANSHKLPYPFQDESINGPIGCVKMNMDTTQPLDFTKNDYEALCELSEEKMKEIEDAAIKKRDEDLDEEVEMGEDFAEMEKEELEEEQVEEELVNDEEEEEDEAMNVQNLFVAQLTQRVMAFYQEQHNRDPTPEELKDAMKEVLKAMQDGSAVYDEEPEEEEKTEATEPEVGSKRQREESELPASSKPKTSES